MVEAALGLTFVCSSIAAMLSQVDKRTGTVLLNRPARMLVLSVPGLDGKQLNCPWPAAAPRAARCDRDVSRPARCLPRGRSAGARVGA
jgi:hypothetical protein